MIERVHLLRYKGFEDFELRLGRQAVLVGPNNAGKTTLVHSLRLAASLLRFARRRNAYEAFEDDVTDKYSRSVMGYPIAHVGTRELSWYRDENLRHEFRDDATALVVTFNSKACLRVVWPVDSPAFFYIDKLPGLVARSAAEVRRCVPIIGVVPTLLPLEEREDVLDAHYVWESVGTRRTSRHFRNQLYHTRDRAPESFKSFVAFAVANTPEISNMVLRDVFAGPKHELDLFVTETATGKEKEVYWLGDGLQIWT